uniref:Uncharacterized protein n=1 Tax=Panagrolaimus davidi TaxID=227884 RepID=A0A914Q5F6_9BILA
MEEENIKASEEYLLNLESIEEWKKGGEDFEDNFELLKDITMDLVHKYGSPKFPKFSDEIVKGVEELFVLHYSRASEDHRRTLLKLIGILPYDEKVASVLFTYDLVKILLNATGLVPEAKKVDGFRVVFEALRTLHHALHVSDSVQQIFIENCEELLFERMKCCLSHLKEDEEVTQKPQFYFLNNASEILIEELLYSDLRLAFVSCLSSVKLQVCYFI